MYHWRNRCTCSSHNWVLFFLSIRPNVRPRFFLAVPCVRCTVDVTLRVLSWMLRLVDNRYWRFQYNLGVHICIRRWCCDGCGGTVSVCSKSYYSSFLAYDTIYNNNSSIGTTMRVSVLKSSDGKTLKICCCLSSVSSFGRTMTLLTAFRPPLSELMGL